MTAAAAATVAITAAGSGARPLEIDALRIGQRVDGLLYLAQAGSDSVRNNTWYLHMTFRDLRGSTIEGKLWNCTDDAPTTGVYRLAAKVEAYRGAPQLKLLRRPVAAPDVDATPYLVAVRSARAGEVRLREQLLAALAEIRHGHLAPLLANVFDDETLRLLLEAPAAVQHHGCFPGGLAYHTLEVRRIALELAKSWGGAGCDLELLAAGALLHDVGKIDEMEYSPDQGRVTYRSSASAPLGRLYGHMVCGALRIHREAFDLGIEETPVVQHLIHLVVSHHGRPEWGAPVPPATPEARLLHAADQCASQIEETLDVLDRINTRPDGDWLDGGRSRHSLYRGFSSA